MKLRLRDRAQQVSRSLIQNQPHLLTIYGAFKNSFSRRSFCVPSSAALSEAFQRRKQTAIQTLALTMGICGSREKDAPEKKKQSDPAIGVSSNVSRLAAGEKRIRGHILTVICFSQGNDGKSNDAAVKTEEGCAAIETEAKIEPPAEAETPTAAAEVIEEVNMIPSAKKPEEEVNFAGLGETFMIPIRADRPHESRQGKHLVLLWKHMRRERIGSPLVISLDWSPCPLKASKALLFFTKHCVFDWKKSQNSHATFGCF